MIVLIINWPNFVYLLVDPRFLSPLKFLWIAVRFRMDAPDRHNGQRDKRTNEQTDGRTDRDASLYPSVRPSVSSSLRWSLTLRTWVDLAVVLIDSLICRNRPTQKWPIRRVCILSGTWDVKRYYLTAVITDMHLRGTGSEECIQQGYNSGGIPAARSGTMSPCCHIRQAAHCRFSLRVLVRESSQTVSWIHCFTYPLKLCRLHCSTGSGRPPEI